MVDVGPPNLLVVYKYSVCTDSIYICRIRTNQRDIRDGYIYIYITYIYTYTYTYILRRRGREIDRARQIVRSIEQDLSS